ncbi:MAG: hypothetical protein VYE77_01135 [Planctomycetota bacterium]|nr:hypothetical protein [Planctomycetota bacterium]
MRTTFLATIFSVAVLAPVGLAQNMLANPGFENGLTGWSFFGNASGEVADPSAGVIPRTGNGLAKLYGQFNGAFNVSGIFQAFPASAGQTFTIDCWSRQSSLDPMTGLGAPADNWVVMKMAFFDAAHVEIGNAEGTVLDGNSVQDVWIDNPAVTGTAPINTVSVEAFILFLQPGMAPGSAQIDDMEFTGPPSVPAYPGSGEDVQLSSSVDGSFPTAGPGNDIKSATGGSTLWFNVSSPQGGFDQQAYYLVGQLFTTNVPPVPLPAFPDLWFDFNSFFVLVNGAGGPLGPPVVGPNGGSSSFFTAPSNFGNLSLMVQGLVINSATNNGLYAATDAHEIQFQ